MVSVRVNGLQNLKKELQVDTKAVDKALRKAIIETAFEVQGNAKESIQRGSKTGREYQKYNPRRVHRASAKGQAPASDTGNLANSIKVKKSALPKASVIAQAGYSGFLEEELDRPFMQPALDDAESYMDSVLNKLIDRALS